MMNFTGMYMAIDWDFPVDKISAKVNLPDGAGILQNSCYTGALDSNSQNCVS